MYQVQGACVSWHSKMRSVFRWNVHIWEGHWSIENRTTVHLHEVKIESYPLIEKSTSSKAIHHELTMPQIAIKFVHGASLTAPCPNSDNAAPKLTPYFCNIWPNISRSLKVFFLQVSHPIPRKRAISSAQLHLRKTRYCAGTFYLKYKIKI
jgi:hypothetical protein